MAAFEDENTFGVADKHQLEKNPVTESSKVGKLLYEVENKRTKCDGTLIRAVFSSTTMCSLFVQNTAGAVVHKSTMRWRFLVSRS
mmetsp:Transcript_27184/g.49135  ORF Transcript_27184/g.49135 Transcript_27184/m.49135 type:complete len:85 (+) Transcript_27184:264-518(+)